ncbi:DNA primase [Halobacteriovorax sp. JY17]|uniref:DNA primase n=1 Tax=Halobacteriovorax sp. JY17 TaxID=2014617 RepID=UPI000C63E9A2|nr:DNA primase [Halobacteriovorax sp. JY17]PIK14735.1 MAG: DNA primase [Halobacteriovorax sp. JY17]
MSLKDLKERIVTEIPISAIVGDYITVTKKGTTALSVCPFHNDHKPSMNVTDSRGRYKCFACEAGGNAIDFVINYKNLDFIEALKEICTNHGINFDDYNQQKAKPPKVLMAEKILTKSSQLYQRIAESGRFEEYQKFIKNRGLSTDIAKTYNLGYAPKDSKLTSYLSSIPDQKERDFALTIAKELGLIRVDKNDSKSHYDTFRDRIIFPIWDQYGQVVGYTSRAVFDYQKAKYMNSLESFIFKKKHILYGLHLAKSSIRSKDAVVLVEGNMDQIALFNKGFTNSVGIQGIAMGDSSLVKLKALTKNIYLALDNDNAGWNAAERINKQCLDVGITAKFVDLAPHKDPDDFLNAEGSVELQKRIDQAKAFIDVQIERVIPDRVPELLDAQLAILNQVFSILSPLKASLAATERAAQAARTIGLKSEATQIISNYKEFLSGNQAPTNFAPPPMDEPEGLITESFHEEISFEEMQYLTGELETIEAPALSKIETTFLSELIKHPECLTSDKIGELLDYVSSNEVQKYITRLKELFYEIDESEFVPIVSNFTKNGTFSSALKEVIATALKNYRAISHDDKAVSKIIFDIRKKLEITKLTLKKDEVKMRKKSCTTNEEINELMNELLIIEKEIIKVKALKHKTPGGK